MFIRFNPIEELNELDYTRRNVVNSVNETHDLINAPQFSLVWK